MDQREGEGGDEMTEEWKEVKGFSDYEVSSKGRFKSIERVSRNGKKLKEKIMKQRRDRYNKLSCNLVDDEGISRRKYVHIEMAKSFMPHYTNEFDVFMKDGDDFNLHLNNLVIEKRSDKRRKLFTSEKMIKKERAHLSGEQRNRIKESIKSGFSNSQIAERENVSRQSVARVRKRSL